MQTVNTFGKTGSFTTKAHRSQLPSGVIRVSEARSAATCLSAVAILTDKPAELLNLPAKLVDVQHKARFIEAMGGGVSFDTEALSACSDRSKRTTYLLTAGQLHHCGAAFFLYPRGC